MYTRSINSANIIFITLTFLVMTGCGRTNHQDYILKATSDFQIQNNQSGYAPYYIDQQRSCLAINAAKYKDEFGIASHRMTNGGKFEFIIHTMAEEDGESSYILYINGSKKGELQNTSTNLPFQQQQMSFGVFELNANDSISIASNSHTNGKIPEGNTTAYSRGRWQKLELIAK